MAGSISEWTKVIVNPLGLAGFVLFLLFGALARAKRKDERRWILPTALIAACVALVGGLSLAYRDVAHRATKPNASATAIAPAQKLTSQQQNDHSQQSSTGDSSPNIQGIQGSVSVTYGSGAQTNPKKQKTMSDEAKKAAGN